MKKVLGLDLGSASVGWALISEKENVSAHRTDVRILGMGSRIIPYEGTEDKDFSKGTGESRNAIRTKARTVRKGYDRYQLRRKYLFDALAKNNMMPGEKENRLNKMELWELRNKAANKEISLPELGRIFLMLNQKRGYQSSRSDANLNKKDTEYIAEVKNRHSTLKNSGLTIGQYFYSELKKNQFFRIKENIFPREAYLEEFDKICHTQQDFHPVLKKELISRIRNEIIYFQRRLKSQKGLVSVCEFEGYSILKEGKEYFVGPKVAPKSSPVFQVAKIWENINNLKVNDRNGREILISHEKKLRIFEHLDNNERLTKADLLKILELKKDNCYVNKQIEKGIQGNLTKTSIKKCFDGSTETDDLLRFGLKTVTENKQCFLYDRKTGEIVDSKAVKYIDASLENEPLYKFWHIIYSINDLDDCSNTLHEKFNLEKNITDRLARLDFRNSGFGNKSVKAIRKILPYLMEGICYSDAMSYAGYDHSNSITREQNLNRKLLERVKPIPKNTLHQPVVEKILNQMVNVVNAIIETHGKPDEIRIELSRELKQSKEERNDAEREINQRERENVSIAKRLSEFNMRATRNNIIKWRLYEEINNEEKKLNAVCIYCGQPISLHEAIMGKEVDVEHIIPRSRLFDDSQSNKTLAHRRCNANKGDMTAYDFMKSKSEKEFTDYVDRVNNLYANYIIRKTKRDKLLMTAEKIPDNFIDRQLRESQYISSKAREILQTVCRNVWCTSGQITSELRHFWGWDDIIMDLQIPKYKSLGLTELKEWESDNGRKKHTKHVIKDWTKRDDHRHHAIDALTIACTKQSFIQRFNTLNSEKTREDMYREIEERSASFREKFSLLEKYIISQQPMSVAKVQDAVSRILISFKAGKKVAVKGCRKVGKTGNKRIIQNGIIVPRGSLSEESVYGKILTIEEKKPVRYLFDNTHLIFKPYIKTMVEEKISRYGGDIKKAYASLKKDPIYLDKAGKRLLEYGTCFREDYVIKYPVDINFNKVEKVIDPRVKGILEKRLKKYDGKPKLAFKDVQKEDNTIIKWYEDEGLLTPVRSVRCFTGLSAVVPLRKDSTGRPTGYVKPGNNHHIAIYSNADGNRIEHVCTFWHAVERKKYGFPVIIENTNEIWDRVQNGPEDKYPESFLHLLPPPNLSILFSMQKNEMFILGLPTEEVQMALNAKDHRIISENLYRVQKLTIIPSSGQINVAFRHHVETRIIDDNNSRISKRYYNIQSISALFALNPFKIKITNLGEILMDPPVSTLVS